MSKKIQTFNIYQRIFCKIAGADTRILEVANDSRENKYFTILGTMIFVLSLFTWYAIDYALMLVVTDKFSAARVGMTVFGLGACFVYINLYRFVFAITPGEGEGAHDLTNNFSYNAGLFVRFFCVALLGIIVAKCYELYIFERSIEPLITLFNRGDQVELRYQTRLYLGFSVSEIEYIKTGGLLARIKLMHALMGWKMIFSTLPLTFMFSMPLILKTFSTTVQDGDYQKLKVLDQNLIIENARLLTMQHVKKTMKAATGKEIQPYNLQNQ